MPPPPSPYPQTLKNGIKNDRPVPATEAVSSSKTRQTRQETRRVKAKRALTALVVGVGANLSLTMVIILLFGSGKRYDARPKPLWLPPLWLVHSASLGSSFFMGLASWLVWAEGGFRAQSGLSLPLYVAATSLGVVWDPLVLVMGADWVGLAFCLVHWGILVACKREFGKVNHLAGEIVRPCLVWVGFLAILTFGLAIS